MVQVLPYVPGFGERIAPALQQATATIGGALAKKRARTALQKMEDEAANGVEISPLAKIRKYGLIEQAEGKGAADFYAKSELKGGEYGGSNLKAAANALDDLEGLIDKSGIGLIGALNPSSEARKNRGIFKSTQAAILPIFKKMFPRGLTEKEFKYIQDNWIPQSNDSEATIRGKIEGLRELAVQQGGPEQVLKGPKSLMNNKPKRIPLEEIFQ